MMSLERRNLALALTLVSLVVIFVIYAPTLRSMASVWFTSNSHLHGILILPMSAYIVWHKREHWLGAPTRPAVAGMLLLLACVLAWTVAELVSVQLVAQLAFVGMIGAATWSVLGTTTARILLFPLLYAFLAVPFGEFLVPALMDWTAYSTVRALQITGIPVLHEGHLFSLPSGNFEVIEACSGIRFLIVTVVLGIYFAHETFRSWVRRTVFVVLAALAIIIANWVRAYLVVLIAHLTDMRFGSGQSHVYMGWVIFLLVITTLFWLGRRYEDAHEEPADERALKRVRAAGPEISGRVDVVFASVIVLALLAAGPSLLDASLDRVSGSLSQPSLPTARGGWSGPEGVSLGYRPAFRGASDSVAGQYLVDSQVIELHIIFYSEQQQGNELVGWQSKLFDAEQWRRVRRGRADVAVPETGETLTVRSLLIDNGRQLLQLWYWYDIGGALTSRPRVAKIRQAWNAVTGSTKGDALLVVAMPVDYLDATIDTAPMRAFVSSHLGGMQACLRTAADEHGSCVSGAVQNQAEAQ